MVFWRKIQQQRRASLEEGLALLNERLGLTPGTKTRTTATRIDVQPTEQHARNLYYGPDMDGNAEPGEVVWALVPSTPPEERAMLVVGRDHHDVLALLIHCGEEPVSDPASATEEWLGIGTGDWDASGQPGWLRLDLLLVVPEASIHRRGATLPARRFDRVANRLRDTYHWT